METIKAKVIPVPEKVKLFFTLNYYEYGWGLGYKPYSSKEKLLEVESESEKTNPIKAHKRYILEVEVENFMLENTIKEITK